MFEKLEDVTVSFVIKDGMTKIEMEGKPSSIMSGIALLVNNVSEKTNVPVSTLLKETEKSLEFATAMMSILGGKDDENKKL